MTHRLYIGPLGDVEAPQLINCKSCCYVLPGYSGSSVVINGTHMINGTDVTPVTPVNGVGYFFNNNTDIILPCTSSNLVTGHVYYYQQSSSSNVRASLGLLAWMLLMSVLVNV